MKTYNTNEPSNTSDDDCISMVVPVGYLAKVPDGYYANGDSRPWRLVTVQEHRGNLAYFTYIDKLNTGIIPISGLKRI